MSNSKPATLHEEVANEWITWHPGPRHSSKEESLDIEKLRLRIFRITIIFGFIALSAITARILVIQNVISIPDVLNILFLGTCLVLSYRKPEWRCHLSWAVLLSFIINCLDGLGFDSVHGFTPTHILLPLLVLYGALLGNIRIIIVALVFACSVYVWTAVQKSLTDTLDLYILSNFMITAIVTGLASYGVWFQHQRLGKALNQKARLLENELKIREQLASALFHDIRNPLGTLMGTAELCQLSGKTERQDLETILSMGGRIDEIIDSIHNTKLINQKKTVIRVQSLVEQLQAVLSRRLEEKELTFNLAEGHDLTVLTEPNLLCNSVLSNLLTNAIKFSPRGGRIELFARKEKDRVRIEVQDQGRGFSPEWMQALREGHRVPHYSGTEGESGFGLGLGIAAAYLDQIDGRLQFRNRPRGACAAILLPAASE